MIKIKQYVLNIMYNTSAKVQSFFYPPNFFPKKFFI